MPKWRMAKSLEVLLKQLNEKFPARSKVSDGGIGDAAHASRNSDHNPWVQYGGQGIVTARDFTHDPANGLDSEELAECLRGNRDRRIKYIISNKKICSFDKQDFKWRPYTGRNPHSHHVHLSVREEPSLFDDMATWDLNNFAGPRDATKSAPPERPLLKLGSVGDDVKVLQQKLFVTGVFDERTQEAVRSLQEAHDLHVDGIVGPYTWDAIDKGG